MKKSGKEPPNQPCNRYAPLACPHIVSPTPHLASFYRVSEALSQLIYKKKNIVKENDDGLPRRVSLRHDIDKTRHLDLCLGQAKPYDKLVFPDISFLLVSLAVT